MVKKVVVGVLFSVEELAVIDADRGFESRSSYVKRMAVKGMRLKVRKRGKSGDVNVNHKRLTQTNRGKGGME